MTKRLLTLMGATLIGLVLAMGTLAAAKSSVTGSFLILWVAPPTAGQSMVFYTQTSPINDCCGGDSVLAWVDVSCSANGVQVFSQIVPASSHVTPGVETFQNYAYVTLDSATWAAAGYPGGTCTAFLFWDGAHRPTRKAGNTLSGPLTFVVAGGL